MTEWISVYDQLPNPFTPVWIYWRDREVLIGCYTYEGKDTEECEPNSGWYSYSDEKCRSTNWWMPIGKSTIDKPFPPKK